MAWNSQQRRAAKQRRRDQHAGPRQPVASRAAGAAAATPPQIDWEQLLAQSAGRPGSVDDEPTTHGHGRCDPPDQGEQPYTRLLAKNAVLQAARTSDDLLTARRSARELLNDHPGGHWRPIAAALGDVLAESTGQIVAGGWQPDDLVAIVLRRANGCALSLVARLLAAETARHPAATLDPRWRNQLESIPGGRTPTAPRFDSHPDVTSGLLLLCLLDRLPKLAALLPPPGRGTGGSGVRPGGVDAKVLARGRGLLAKAESTDYPEEAEALSAKAQELMSRHALDRLVAEAAGDEVPEQMAAVRLWLDAPYLMPKAMLVNAVAEANRCRSVFSEDLGFVTVVGAPADIDGVLLLVVSLLVQADRAMLGYGQTNGRCGRSRTRPFRHAFLLSFASRIGERLGEVNKSELAASPQAGTLVPVLRRRSEELDDAVSGMFGSLRSRGAAISNREGWAAGTAAADRAALDFRDKLGPVAR